MLDVVIIIVSIAVLAAVVIGLINKIVDAVFCTAGDRGFNTTTRVVVAKKKNVVIRTLRAVDDILVFHTNNMEYDFVTSPGLPCEGGYESNTQSDDATYSVVWIYQPLTMDDDEYWSRHNYVRIGSLPLETQLTIWRSIDKRMKFKGWHQSTRGVFVRSQYKRVRRLLKELENGVETP